MTKRETFLLKVHEVTQFCVQNTGRVFNCWPMETIFLYVAFAAMANCVFVKRVDGKVAAVAFAFPETQERIDAGATFDWKIPKEADVLLIREVISDKETCKEFGKLASRQWPNLHKFFTFRCRPELTLVELSAGMMRRFYGYGRAS